MEYEKIITEKEVNDYSDLSALPRTINNSIKWKSVENCVVNTRHLGQNFSFMVNFSHQENRHSILLLTCNSCGNSKRVRADRFSTGVGCNMCKSQYSLPERIVATVLKENNINFTMQARFKQLGQKRFDFLVVELGNIFLIEVNGEAHYRDVINWNADNTRESDKVKKHFIDKYNIDLITIDARKYSVKSIIDQLTKSKIKKFIHVCNIDDITNKIVVLDNVEVVRDIINMYSEGYKYKEISKKTGKSISAIHDLLVRYSVNLRYGEDNRGQWRKKEIRCLNDGRVFDSLKEAGIYGGLKNSSNVWKCLNRGCKSAGKHPETGEPLRWEYVD